ncbi:MAG: hypothetical protein J6Z11_13570 [Candidatus Riflebacteria bacterium]|nr:hypothetical protein [Candidatus Riflebacteria bacterium]
MTICDTTPNKSDLMVQVIALNKAILKLNIEQLENEILSFEDILHDALNHPEKANNSYLKSIKEKFAKLHLLQQKLASLELVQ